MVVTILVGLSHIDQKPCKVDGVSGCAYLVVNDTNHIVCLAHIKHGLDEVLAVPAKHPGDPYDEEFIRSSGYRKFTLQLSLSVVINRGIVLAVRLPGGNSLPVENIVCTDVEDLCTY